MSYTKKKTLMKRLTTVRSLKGFAQSFMLGNMAGQKLFLHNDRIPRVINISFNEKTCMFSCRMCPFNEDSVRSRYRKGTSMSMETLERLIDSVPNDPFYSFDMSSIGETLEFDRLPEFISRMKERRPLVNTIVSTNAVLLSEQYFNALIDSGLDSIQFSLYAENAEDHQFITGTKSFERVKNNIIRAGQIRSQRGAVKPFMQTFMIECQENTDTAQTFLDFWSQHVDQAFLRPMYNAGRAIKGMTPKFTPTPPSKRYPCIMPWYSTALKADGSILPCYMFHWHEEGWNSEYGNINQATLADIWASDAHRKFRQAHLTQRLDDYPICKRCDLWSAYTNIWKELEDGTFVFDQVSPLDLFRPCGEHRGG